MADFTFKHDPETCTLRIALHTAKFDAAHTQPFLAAIKDDWPTPVNRVELDLEAVTFIDSSGVGALLTLAKRLPTDADPVLLKNPGEQVTGVLELLRLQRIFRFQNEQPMK
jgi:anti-sigma B factor antagonist